MDESEAFEVGDGVGGVVRGQLSLGVGAGGDGQGVGADGLGAGNVAVGVADNEDLAGEQIG